MGESGHPSGRVMERFIAVHRWLNCFFFFSLVRNPEPYFSAPWPCRMNLPTVDARRADRVVITMGHTCVPCETWVNCRIGMASNDRQFFPFVDSDWLCTRISGFEFRHACEDCPGDPS
jgi:hypothetical protein